ncbi:GNAT family N-acetyltransferase [Arthrobacter sp. ATA002]|uniref:GNAT family N-acetyltransferase n=1 Tax=Arthrobacter sp. ATA002 TaxID=2991715 RepID=UPI0022A6677E|nr:GNAT family N-acetyltransferase [Arthrobacter sp. ATA002]WAP52059.1 GNAT family N-acetyltransferase [Arthrobacter sp. ATA002]
MNITLRTPTAADVPALAAVHHRCWVETYTGMVRDAFWEGFTVASLVPMWERLAAGDTPLRRTALAESGGELVGLAMAGPSSLREYPAFPPVRERQLFMLYVLASHHGTGAGQSLLEAVVEAGPAQLWVAADNLRAQAFYRRKGFHPDGARVAATPMSDDIPVLRMVR